jgi:hypothetical protein
MRDPKVLTGLPGKEKVTTRRHGKVGAIVVTYLIDDGSSEVRRSANSTATDTVQGGINGFLDLCFPVASGILGNIDGTGRGRHFSLGRAESINGGGLTRKLGGERNTLPRLARVLSVKKERGLTKDPAFAIFEGSNLETVCNLLIGIKIREGSSLPRLTTIVGLSKRTTSTHKISMVGTEWGKKKPSKLLIVRNEWSGKEPEIQC